MFDPWKTRAMGGYFAGIKVSQANYADPDYILNWAHCKNVLYRMPYHFLTWTTSANLQAETFWRLLEPEHHAMLPMVVDFEWWNVVPAKAMDILYAFTERLKDLASPLPMGIYTAKSFWDPNGSTANYWKQFHLWLCDIAGEVPVPKPWSTWKFWQYTFKLDGLAWGAESLDLDGDYYNGTLADMRAEFSLPELDGLTQPPVITPVLTLEQRVARLEKAVFGAEPY